jgi:hypothetical protein
VIAAAAEAFLLQLTKRGLEDDGDAARAALVAIEEVTERPGAHQGLQASSSAQFWYPEASHLHAGHYERPQNAIPTARPPEWPSNLWLVEAALARLHQ